jgi:hypothetical protein
MRAREYVPETGRFLETDPIQCDSGGACGSTYVYVDDQPTTKVDPSGECSMAGLGMSMASSSEKYRCVWVICTWDNPRQAWNWTRQHPGTTAILAASAVAVVVATPIVLAYAGESTIAGVAMRSAITRIGAPTLNRWSTTIAGRLFGRLMFRVATNTTRGAALFGAGGTLNKGAVRMGLSSYKNILYFSIRIGTTTHIDLWPPK